MHLPSVEISHEPEHHDVVFVQYSAKGTHVERAGMWDVILHSLGIVNACVGEKILVRAEYTTDSDRLRINLADRSPDSASRALSVEYPALPQTYFSWTAKTLQCYLLWLVSELEPDGNAVIRVTLESFTIGRREVEQEARSFHLHLSRTGGSDNDE